MRTLTCMTTRELLDSLTVVHTEEAVTFDDHRGYIDWSTRHSHDVRTVEIGDRNGNTVELILTHADLLQLHAALTLTLIRDAQEG